MLLFTGSSYAHDSLLFKVILHESPRSPSRILSFCNFLVLHFRGEIPHDAVDFT